MSSLPDTLPDDPVALKALLFAYEAEAKKTQHALEAQITKLNDQLHNAFEALRLERARRYGSQSEKAPWQGELFDEAESNAEEQAEGLAGTQAAANTARKKRSTGRKPLPAELTRVEHVHTLDDADLLCPCGCTLEEIGEDISEQLEIEPAKIHVIRHIRKKYACKACEESVKSAPVPTVLLPKAIASANTMAYLIVSKYADGLPLYRLSRILERYGVDLPRQTLSESVLATAKKLEPLIHYLEHMLEQGALIHMDETRVQVLNEPNKTPQSQSYMWVRQGGPPGKPIVHFHYNPSRATAVPEQLLSGYQGVLMSDGYEPYRKVAALKGLTHLCCWSHARRKFKEAKKAQPNGRSGGADQAIAFIAKLYAVETRNKDYDAATRHHSRQTDSAAVLYTFHEWLLDQQNKVAPKKALGKAIHYTLKYWTELSRYVNNGTWPIDNNLAENAIRPFVIGRKNWLFSNSQRGARASANLYSLIETAKANNREPYQYLCWLFDRLPYTADDDIGALAPWNMPSNTKLP